MYGLKVRDALHVRVVSGRLVCFIYDEVFTSAQSKSAKARRQADRLTNNN
jgi:hypothetical protein